MSERRSLVEGMKRPLIDPQKEQEFIAGARSPGVPAPVAPSVSATVKAQPARVSFSTRIRGDFAAALKRASLQRQIDGMEPSAINDLLEQALEPWLKTNGYL